MGKACYMLAIGSNGKELAMIVETLLEQGWKLAGGVAVFGFPGGREYTQALYRPPEAPPAAGQSPGSEAP